MLRMKTVPRRSRHKYEGGGKNRQSWIKYKTSQLKTLKGNRVQVEIPGQGCLYGSACSRLKLRLPDLLHLLHTEQEEVVLASLVSMPLILTLPRQVERLHPALIQRDQQLGTRISWSQRKTCCHHLLLRRRILRARHRSISWSSSVSSSQTANLDTFVAREPKAAIDLPARPPSILTLPEKGFWAARYNQEVFSFAGLFFQCCAPIWIDKEPPVSKIILNQRTTGSYSLQDHHQTTVTPGYFENRNEPIVHERTGTKLMVLQSVIWFFSKEIESIDYISESSL
jgi:hypothetical protein